MSLRVILRPDVPTDLHDIVERLDQDNIAVADRFLTSTFSAFEDLAAVPGMGSPKHFPQRALSGIRSWPVPGFPNHLVYYKTHPEAIIVVAVLHGARDVPAILASRIP